MSEQELPEPASAGKLPQGEAFRRNVANRRTIGIAWRALFLSAVVIGLVTLALLLYNVINESLGLVAVQSRVPRAEVIGDREIADVPKDELIVILRDRLRSARLRALERDAPFEELGKPDLETLLREEILREEIVRSWPLNEALFDRAAIEAEVAEDYPRATLEFKSWISPSFLRMPGSSRPEFAGVRTALIGSLWMIAITMLVAVPLGVGAAIYLEEYAGQSWFNRAIQTNINNLAGVPSIIYGMLGLAIFVRALGQITSGAVFGVPGADPNAARTIASAGLTMALLILPIIIISAQEAIRAVPRSLRMASLALGATKWQTIWHHVLPVAFPSILTGTILAMSRAIGETAPLVVIGAATFIVSDPDGPFARFTALPIQIYQWTARPQDLFRDIAAAAIIVLLVLLLSLNSVAIFLRNRYSKRM